MDDLAQGRAARLAALVAEDGWLNLTDRIEIAPGRWSVGSGATCDLRLSTGPEVLGWLSYSVADGAAFSVENGPGQQFQDAKGGFPQLKVAPFLLELHRVDGQAALRVRLIDHPARVGFAGLRHFQDDPAWVILARWEKLAVPLATSVDMVSGAVETVLQTHVAKFAVDGCEIGLVPTHVKGGQPMFVFRDATSGTETYGASRFLLGEVVDDTTIKLDFNKAHNPPCAFTEFAICPLPPRQNILPFAVRAGELAP